MALHDEMALVSLVWAPITAPWGGEMALNTFHVHHHHETSNAFGWGDSLPALATGVRGKLVDNWGAIAGMFGGDYEITAVKAAQLDTAGHYISESVAPVAGHALKGSASTILPPEAAVTLSLFGYDPNSFTQHRGRKRGRMYLPYIAASLSTGDGKVDFTPGGGFLGGWTAAFNGIQGMECAGQDRNNPDTPDYWSVVIPSRVDGSITQLRHLGFSGHFSSQERRQPQSAPGYIWGNLAFTSAADDPSS